MDENNSQGERTSKQQKKQKETKKQNKQKQKEKEERNKTKIKAMVQLDKISASFSTINPTSSPEEVRKNGGRPEDDVEDKLEGDVEERLHCGLEKPKIKP